MSKNIAEKINSLDNQGKPRRNNETFTAWKGHC